ncbi:MAG: hypothetical protein NWQ54_15865, partial [Paraglaciecola sp.]|nr:hypothetical protein [Paraglaciecola sp.]
DKQIQVLNIGRFIVMDRFISWNNCQFRKPEKLWQFVKYLTPIMKLLPNDYFVHIDILNKSAIESENRKPITSAWQIPNDIEIPLQMKHTVYPDAKGKGYAALTLRTVPKQPLERYIGDHGFHVAMTALYFYYGKALERDVSNSSDKSTANKLYVITQVVTSADITNETQYAQKINEPVEDSLTDKDVLSAIDTASNIDDVKDDKCSDNTDDDDVIQYLTDPSILSSDELNPKKKRRRRKSNDSFDGIPDDLDFDWSEEQE